MDVQANKHDRRGPNRRSRAALSYLATAAQDRRNNPLSSISVFTSANKMKT